jgi:tetratricopeptide (TPR) repeat protein
VVLRKLLAPAAVLALGAALVLVVGSARSATAQVGAEEGAAYTAWLGASQANDVPKAIAAAQDYLKAYPQGQYAEFLTKWLNQARFSALDAAIKAQNMDEMIKVGREILASDPDNLNVIYALAFNLRLRELLANPPKFDHAAEAKEFAEKAVSLVESGKTLAGVQSFDKDATLAWLDQELAILAVNAGNTEEAVKLYQKSSSLAPDDVGIKGRNLLAELTIRQSEYSDAAKAYNELPEADRSAAEPSPDVTAARDKVNTAADALIDVCARFVVFGRAKNLPAATVDKVNDVLETAYKTRFPEDTSLDGLKKILEEKGGAPAPGA